MYNMRCKWNSIALANISLKIACEEFLAGSVQPHTDIPCILFAILSAPALVPGFSLPQELKLCLHGRTQLGRSGHSDHRRRRGHPRAAFEGFLISGLSDWPMEISSFRLGNVRHKLR